MMTMTYKNSIITEMPGFTAGGGNKGSDSRANNTKAEVGRTERAATRRNKIFSSQMQTDLREIERAMKISLRQIEQERKDLYTEMDSLESRSGWLRNTEKAAVPAAYLTAPGRKSTAAPKTAKKREVHVAILVGRHNTAARATARAAAGGVESGTSDDDESLTAGTTPQFVRSHTDMPLITTGAVSKRAATSMSGANNRPSSQVRFSRQQTRRDRQTPEGVFDDTDDIERDGEFASPTQSILSTRRQSPSNRLYSSSSLSSSSRRKSFLYIPASDERYRVLDVPLQMIDVRKIKEHARSCQKLRIEGQHIFIKKSLKQNTGGEATGGGVETRGEYVPKRVRQMREERLRMRCLNQDFYNKNVIENALGKFKDMYIVPTGGGLNEANDFIAGISIK